MTNQRDLELLSAYLDGELNPSDSARLASRLKASPELDAVLDDLRAARTLLRRLPKRRAPRNFTLTRKMVGLSPPLPRSYPVFRFVTTVATLMFFLTFGLNALAPQFLQPIGVGGGGGADQPELFSAQAPAEAVATEAAAATEPAVGAAELAPQSTLAPPEGEAARATDSAAAKDFGEGFVGVQDQSEVGRDPSFIPSAWLLTFAGIALLGSIFMSLMRRRSMNRWK